MTSQIEKILRWTILSLIFVIPFIVFIVMGSMFFPYIVGKNLAFRVLVEIMFVAWLALTAIEAKWRPRASIILIAVTAFVAIVALADIFGANPIKSFWSNFERMEGLVTIVHLFAYMLVTASMFTSEKVSLWFWRLSLGVASLIAVNAFFQFLGHGTTRLDSTLGNPIYLAVYALFNIFIALILFFRNGANKYERIFYALVIPVQFWVLFMTASRGAIIGVVGGLLLASLGILFTMRKERYVQLLAGGMIAIIVLGLGVFWMARDTNFVKNNSTLNRFSAIALDKGTVFARTIVWSMALKGIEERPILGWGQENFNLVFNKYYDPRMYAQEQWFDRTHNVVFDWLIAAGILGLLSYISIFLALLWVLYKTKKFNNIQKWLFVGLLAAYSFNNLTVFDQIISYVLFFSVIGWIIATASDIYKREVWFTKKVFKGAWWQVGAVLVVSVILVFSLNYRVYRSNTVLLSGLRDASIANQKGAAGYTKEANLLSERGLEKFILAANMRSNGTQEVDEQTAQMAQSVASAKWMSNSLRKLWFVAGIKSLRFEENRTTGDARFPAFLANLYSSFGLLKEEKVELLKALNMSPKKQTFLIGLARNSARQGNKEETLSFLKQAYELDKGYKLVGILYATQLITNDKIKTFDSEFSGSKYIGENPQVLSELVNKKLYTQAFNFWRAAFTESKNPKTAFLLESIYSKQGNTSKAIESVQEAIKIDKRVKKEGERILETLKK